MNRRRGVSLIELMVVISISGAVLMLVGGVFHRMLQAHQTTMRAAQTELNTSRLSNQFRADVHVAWELKLPTGDADAASLELTTSPSSPRIVYTANSSGVLRQELGAQGILSREVFRLPDCHIQFLEPSTSKGAPALQIVTMIVERRRSTLTPSAHKSHPRRQLAVEAELGRDDRIAGNVRVIPTSAEESP